MDENKETSLLAIPKAIIEKHLCPLLSLKDLSRLARTHKHGNPFFELLQGAKLTRLLECTAFGQQAQLEKILQADPKLLWESGTVTDYAGRTFEDITAFQYALWALDRHMWTMILKYLPEDKAKKQLHDHVYNEKKYKTLHGAHYDFVPLIDALQMYINNYESWSDDQRVEHWCKVVGGAQRHVPVHIANEYCRGDRSFYPTPQFDEDTLPRSLSFYNFRTAAKEEWFPIQPNKGVGFNCGILCSPGDALTSLPYDIDGAWRGRGHEIMVLCAAGSDLVGVIELCKARTNEFVELRQRLLIGLDLPQEQGLSYKS